MFAKITKEICSEKYISISKVLIFIREMVYKIETSEKNTDIARET